MKTFMDLYEFAQYNKESRVRLRSKSHRLSCYSMYIYGTGETVIIEAPNPYRINNDPSPLFRITFSPEKGSVYFNDLTDDGCDIVRNQYCLNIKSGIKKMEEYDIIRTVVVELLTGFRG